jgi:signal transduction histidine kinase/DNA-binding NarL/FixJ family response regulator/CHASE3 domain sensor protein
MRRKLILVLLLSISILLYVAWAAYDSTMQLDESERWVSHTNQVLNTISEMREKMAQSRTHAFNFVITGDPQFIKRQKDASDGALDAMSQLGKLVADSGKQEQLFHIVEPLIVQKLKYDKDVLNRGPMDVKDVRDIVTSNYREGLLDTLRNTFVEMTKEEQDRLVARNNDVRAHVVDTRLRIGFGCLISCIALSAITLTLIRDVRRREVAEQLLRRSESTLRSFYDSSLFMMGILELLPDDLIHISDNQQTAQFHGTSADALKGKRAIADLKTEPGAAKLWMDACQEAMKTGRGVRLEYSQTVGDGVRWISGCVGQIPQEAGSKPRFAYVAEDATERVMLAQQLAQAKSAAEAASIAKSVFLANTSHEIRTPLTAILGFAEMLINDDVAPPLRLQYLETILRNGKHLLQIISDVLDLSKIEADRVEIINGPCNLGTLLVELLSTYRPGALERGLSLVVRFETPVPRTVTTDHFRLSQIVINLLSNAIKFTHEGSVMLLLSYDEAAKDLLISIVDTGIGMSAEQMSRIFTPFTQADGSMTRSYGGTGLGLTISRRLSRMMGGDITVVSTLNRGTTFTIRVHAPAESTDRVSDPDELLAAVVANDRAGPVDEQLYGRVLVVDDGQDNRDLISAYLRFAGAAVETAADGREAVAMASENHYDLIVMDMQMPVMDGYAATQTLRSHGSVTPILALTAHAMPSDRDKCLAAGCSEFLSKPAPRDVLMRTVAKYLAAARDRHEEARQPLASRGNPGGTAAPASAIGQQAVSTASAVDDVVASLIPNFVRHSVQNVEDLNAALARGDGDAAMRVAHQMKGAAGAYGFPDIAAIATRIEDALKADRQAQPTGLASELTTAIRALEQHHFGSTALPSN